MSPSNSEKRLPKGSSLLRNVLFICGQNRLRSPTAEQVFANWPGIETASAGLKNEADSPVTPELLEWAHMVFVMERSHRSKLTTRFKRHLGAVRIICLDITDDYEYMAPELIKLLTTKVSPHLPKG